MLAIPTEFGITDGGLQWVERENNTPPFSTIIFNSYLSERDIEATAHDILTIGDGRIETKKGIPVFADDPRKFDLIAPLIKMAIAEIQRSVMVFIEEDLTLQAIIEMEEVTELEIEEALNVLRIKSEIIAELKTKYLLERGGLESLVEKKCKKVLPEGVFFHNEA